MTADERRLLELLAGSEDGSTDALLAAYGFTVALMVDVVSAGLATAMAERVYAGGKPVEVSKVRITDAGRQALADQVHGDKTLMPASASPRAAQMPRPAISG
jgi:hypothetical protein